MKGTIYSPEEKKAIKEWLLAYRDLRNDDQERLPSMEIRSLTKHLNQHFHEEKSTRSFKSIASYLQRHFYLPTQIPTRYTTKSQKIEEGGVQKSMKSLEKVANSSNGGRRIKILLEEALNDIAKARKSIILCAEATKELCERNKEQKEELIKLRDIREAISKYNAGI